MICKRLSNIVPKLPSLWGFSNCFCSSLIRWLTQDSVSKANRSNADLSRSLFVKGGGTLFNVDGLRNPLFMTIKLISYRRVWIGESQLILQFCSYQILKTYISTSGKAQFPFLLSCVAMVDFYLPQRWDAVNLESKRLVYGECKYLNPVLLVRQYVNMSTLRNHKLKPY